MTLILTFMLKIAFSDLSAIRGIVFQKHIVFCWKINPFVIVVQDKQTEINIARK